jgi:hypothetical protein
MPRGEHANTERLAVEIVRDAELARGWTPGPLLGQHDQHEEGCDLLSTPPNGGPLTASRSRDGVSHCSPTMASSPTPRT